MLFIYLYLNLEFSKLVIMGWNDFLDVGESGCVDDVWGNLTENVYQCSEHTSS